MKSNQLATIPLESCQKLIESVTQATKFCGAESGNQIDTLTASLAAQADSLTSQSNAISWGATLLAFAAVALGAGWGVVAKILIEREAKKSAALVAESEAKLEAERIARAWLQENFPGMASNYMAQLSGRSLSDQDANNIAEHVDE